MQIYLTALGCRLNEAELETWARQFAKAGASITQERHNADAIVLNTCAVTGEAARKSRQHIRRLHSDNPRAKLVVSGCYASLAPEQVAAELGVDLVVPNSEKSELVARSLTLAQLPEQTTAASAPGSAALFQRNRQRAFIKIQDGCRYRCTFCIVTVARGQEVSRSIDDIITEINELHAQGVQECVLTGVHVGGYGSDLDTDLKTLVEAILAQTQIPRIRFASVEPWDLPEGFWALFQNPRLMPHMHLPLQSGSDTILRKMARRCKVDDFKALVNEAQRQVPGFNVTTDIIVGFPGEDEALWQESLATIEAIGFGHIHIFSYSRREGTKAARLPDHLPQKVKSARSQTLHQIAKAQKIAAMNAVLGQHVEVLWEYQKEGLWYGYTPSYLRVATDSDTLEAGQITTVALERVDHDNALIIAR